VHETINATMNTSSLDIDDVTTSFLDEENKLPLIISPRFDDSLDFLCGWLSHNRQWVEEQMLTYGAVIIRGFAIANAPEFERAISSLQPNLSDSYRGTSPRSVFQGTKYTFSAADVRVNYPIAQHIEMSFLKSPPRQLYFGCLKESNSGGGETSLCDFRKVYQDLDPALRDKFERKKLMYSRTHHRVGQTWTTDVGAKLSWPQLFGTSEKSQVEKICQEEEAPMVKWTGQSNDTFTQEWIDDPSQLHPITKERAWFNHAQVFHWTTFPAELWYAFTRIRDFRFFVRCIFLWLVALIKYWLLGQKMALDIRFGDRSPITISEMNEVRRVIHKNMRFSTWQRGDIMCIDNFSVSHGRQPTYDFGRKILVAWSEGYNKTSTTPSAAEGESTNDDLKKSCGVLFNDESVPGAIAATPNTSPDSTLSSGEAQDMKYDLEELISITKGGSSTNLHKRHISCPNPSLEHLFQ